jgi:hypothetical protein
MVVGGYSLDLYCDFPDEAYTHRGSADFAGVGRGSFAAETGPVAKALAKRAGWWMDQRGTRALCPSCRKAGRVVPVLPAFEAFEFEWKDSSG